MKTPSEFFLIITPPRSVCQMVSDLKVFVKAAIGHDFEGHASKAYISLFKYEDTHTESSLYQMEEQLSGYAPFTISIKDLKVHQEEGKKSIYLDIAYKYPIQDLTKDLIGREIDPHITIARKLSEEDFILAWRSLRNLSYRYDFRCDHITVLKKSTGRWKSYLDLALANSKFPKYN